MFELPELVTLAKQMNETLKGKTIQRGQLGNSPHKFVWYNRGHEEFEWLTKGKTIGETNAKGKWLFIKPEPGLVLLLGLRRYYRRIYVLPSANGILCDRDIY